MTDLMFNSYKPGIRFMGHRQDNPRCYAAERGIPSGAILFALIENFIKKWKHFKITPEAPKIKVDSPKCYDT